MAFLVIETDELNEKIRSVILENETIIGRDKTNPVFIDDPRASRQHAKIIKETNGSYCLVDLGSRNGTIVNNEKVFRRKLTNKDRITIGRTVLIFNESSSPPEADMPQAQGSKEKTASETPDKKEPVSEIQKILQNIDAAEDKSAVSTKQTAKISQVNNKTTDKEESAWARVLIVIGLLVFFILILFVAKWAGEKLIAHMVKSREASNITSSPLPK
jgi:pSer/pThr/pTyr-binding forkhead associated (FHA) protein